VWYGRDSSVFRAACGLAIRRLNPRETVNRGNRKGSLMIDTKIILALALLLGSFSLKIGGKPPAGGIPIPNSGVTTNSR
jgi:hypothetical protein